VYATDANGNTLGGVRSPQVDVPVAAFGGVGNTPAFCSLFGTTVPLSQAQMASLYRNHGKFVSGWSNDSAKLLEAGFLRPADADELIASAAMSQIGK
jgi:hypothetical protein